MGRAIRPFVSGIDLIYLFFTLFYFIRVYIDIYILIIKIFVLNFLYFLFKK